MDFGSLFEKISGYDILNHFLPGILFAILGSAWTSYPFLQSEVLVALFAYYFYGLVIGRFGSLVVDPIIKKTGYIKFAPYGDFVKATQTDPKIDTLNTTNNMYRSMLALFISLLAVKVYASLEAAWPWLLENREWILILLLVVLFVFAYRKQTDYIKKRITVVLSED